MTTPDDDATPFPDHVVPGGVPDPVAATAPQATSSASGEAGPDDVLDNEGRGVFPVAGLGVGTIPPPDRR